MSTKFQVWKGERQRTGRAWKTKRRDKKIDGKKHKRRRLRDRERVLFSQFYFKRGERGKKEGDVKRKLFLFPSSFNYFTFSGWAELSEKLRAQMNKIRETGSWAWNKGPERGWMCDG